MQLNILKSNRKTVNYHYLTKYVQGRELSKEDSLVLAPIALQTPYQGGNAVFGARVMIGIDPDEEGIAYKGELDLGKEVNESYYIYPNPAKDVLQIETFDHPFAYNKEVILMDLTGRVVLRHKNEASAMSITLPLHDVQSGVYLLQVIQCDKTLLTERVIVNK